MTKVKQRKLAEIVEPGAFERFGKVTGVYVQVAANYDHENGTGGRSWVLRYSFQGQRFDLGLGSLAETPVKEAMKRARAARLQIKNRINPVAERRAARDAVAKAKAEAAAPKAATFRAAAERYLRDHDARWTSGAAASWKRSLQAAYPILGKLAPGEIEVRHILAVVKPEWEGAPIKWKKVATRVENVLDACHARGEIAAPWSNPASWTRLKHLLPAVGDIHEEKSRAALPVAKAADFMTALQARPGMAARCLQWVMLTACRASEATGACWQEVDLEGKVWTVPADRPGRKGGGEHEVPLPQAAIDLLERLPRIEGEPQIFPAPRGGELHALALRRVIFDMGGAKAGWADKHGAVITPHGMRSCFRDFAGDHSEASREVAEAALGHRIGNKVENAYRRGSALEKRAILMAEWACFLGLQAPPENIEDLEEARRKRVTAG